eukprot:GHVR01108801.1.p1 GENE.GHVR01108801.1~~GHVR01108801.1.p1  ORF type:complete len:151 (-),score=8.95 GHVR01108801.1:10-462(-)
MPERSWTKADAFLLMDADLPDIVYSFQMYSGVIISRKTPLALDFFRQWLAACENLQLISEESSKLGSDYYSYKNHNDDQSLFSLLFKLFDFDGFDHNTRSKFIRFTRNEKKFVAYSTESLSRGLDEFDKDLLDRVDRETNERVDRVIPNY